MNASHSRESDHISGKPNSSDHTNLVFAQQWQVHEDLDGLCVSGHDDEVGFASVQRFGGYLIF